MAITFAGSVGSVTWGYHVAGSIGRWTIARENGARLLTAAVVKLDPFRSTQRPLVFETLILGETWRMPIETIIVEDGTLYATLGPRIK